MRRSCSQGRGGELGLADIRDTPRFGAVLPLRKAGADLVRIATHAPERPDVDIALEADESTSSDLPSVFEGKAILRGAPAAGMALASSELGAKEKRQAVAQFFQNFVGEAQFAATGIAADPAAGTVTLTARGVVNPKWKTDERKRKRALAGVTDTLDFAPDRSRPAWKDIPVVTRGPYAGHLTLRVRLPDGGRGIALEGQSDFKGRIADYDIVRTARIEGGVAIVEERLAGAGGELPAASIAAERDKAAVFTANAPRAVASADATRRFWDLAGGDPPGATQVKAIDAILTAAIAADPDEASPYQSRARFRASIGDRRGAVADVGKALGIEPSVELYLQRAGLEEDLGDESAAAADVEAARKLDPSSAPAVARLARLKAQRGDLPGALALLDERIALGGDMRAAYREEKASLIGEYGDAAEAVKLFDTLVEEKPGSPSLLNGRCWVKGTRGLMLDTALKDCTASIELSSSTGAALDSRAMVWFRMGRYEEALRDLDAVLAATPGRPASRFLRAVVLARVHREADAARDLAIARRLAPTLEKTYARWGIKPEAAAAAEAAVKAKN